MTLSDGATSNTQNTLQAALSTRQKTFFFTGFSQQGIQSCKLHGSFITRPNETRTRETVETGTKATVETGTKATSADETRNNKTGTYETGRESCVDCYPKQAKLNFHLLIFNGLRVIFTKAVTFSTILTFRALMS